MKRALAGALLAGGVAIALGACNGDDSGTPGYGGGGGASCAQYTTCGTCTPVEGCGWCFNASGGMCASHPGACSSASEFTWTWDSSGCPDLDAQVGAPVGSNASADAGGKSDASSAAETGASEGGSDAGGEAASVTHAAPGEAGSEGAAP